MKMRGGGIYSNTNTSKKDILAINAAWKLAVKSLLEQDRGIVSEVKNIFTVRFFSWSKKDFSFENIEILSQVAPQLSVEGFPFLIDSKIRDSENYLSEVYNLITIIVDKDGAVYFEINIPHLNHYH